MKIKSVEIKSFRGIPENLTVTFPLKNKKPSSLVVLGDNGVGKSSIIDAIEFCLQGHISQTKTLASENSLSVLSFNSSKLPYVKIIFENEEYIERNIIDDEQGLLSNLKNPHKSFSVSPFVLRRHDILRFINSSEAERTLVFSNYFREKNSDEWAEHPIDELKRLQDNRLKIKHNRNELILKLAKELKVDVQTIPFIEKYYKQFIKDRVFLGLSKSELESSKHNIKVNQKALQLSEEVFNAMVEYRKIKAEINNYSPSKGYEKFPKNLISQLGDFLLKVSEKLTISFLEISPLPFLEKIEIKYSNKDALALTLILVLKNGKKCSPNQLLSEANLDLLALLFFLSFTQESADRGQSKLLILDDVLQSIDSTIRVSFITHLLKNYPEWQYVITAHDRLWHRQLIELMNLYSHPFFSISIAGWSFEKGPEIKDIATSIDGSLKDAVSEKNLIGICSTAGLLLEQISDSLSKSMGTSIQRKRDDKYTLGDLFPGIVKLLKKTDLKLQVESVEQWMHLRNLIGAHYNEWALSLSLDESLQFGNAVLNLYEVTRCSKCSTWLSSNPSQSFYSCRCSDILIKK